MDKAEREESAAAKTAQVEEEAEENEDTFPKSSGRTRSGNSLLGRRNTGNNLYIKIPANELESQWVAFSADGSFDLLTFNCKKNGVSRSGDSSAEEGESDREANAAEAEPGSSGNLGNNRRNSISMPVLNTMDLDALRQLHEKAIQEKMVTL